MNKPRGLLDAIGEIQEIIQAEGCSWEVAAEIRRLRQKEEEGASNVMWLHSVNGSTAVH
jgi:hypothetical protein